MPTRGLQVAGCRLQGAAPVTCNPSPITCFAFSPFRPLAIGERPPGGFTLRGNRGGAAYVLAITTLLVGTIFALAMIRSAGACFFAEDTRQKKRAAANLAEAGIDYAYWQLHYNGAKLPYSATVSLATGSFSVTATDDGNRSRSTLLITSTGTCGRHSHTAKAVTLGALPYHYAYCENRNADDGDAIKSSGTGRGIRANGRINFNSGSTDVSTGAWATTTIGTSGSITPQYPSSPPILFPEPDSGYYSSVASYTYWGSVTLSSPSVPNQTIVVVVNGDLRMRGTYNGMITIYCSHDITVDADLIPANSNSYLALIAGHYILVAGSAPSCDALFYCHTPGNLGRIELRGVKTVTGCVAADDITTDQATTFLPSARWNLDIMRRMRLPGL